MDSHIRDFADLWRAALVVISTSGMVAAGMVRSGRLVVIGSRKEVGGATPISHTVDCRNRYFDGDLLLDHVATLGVVVRLDRIGDVSGGVFACVRWIVPSGCTSAKC